MFRFSVITFVASGKNMIMRQSIVTGEIALMNSDGTFTAVKSISDAFTCHDLTFFD